jgi:hypothetical protein
MGVVPSGQAHSDQTTPSTQVCTPLALPVQAQERVWFWMQPPGPPASSPQEAMDEIRGRKMGNIKHLDMVRSGFIFPLPFWSSEIQGTPGSPPFEYRGVRCAQKVHYYGSG